MPLKKDRQTTPIIVALAAAMFFGVSLFFAHAQVSAVGPSSDQLDVISSSCQTLKQNLKTIQRTDSRTRSYLGSVYQTLLTNYITPLNLSLVKHNRPSTTITRLYSDILDSRSDFVEKFTSYSQAYEELLNVDCKNDSTNFYYKLENVRKSRVALNDSAKHLRTLFGNFYTATARLKEND